MPLIEEVAKPTTRPTTKPNITTKPQVERLKATPC